MSTEIQVEREQGTLRFHSDWFTVRLNEWELILKELIGRQKFLEVGSFEGQSACWFLENALADNGILYCIDHWKGSPGFEIFDSSVVSNSYDTFCENVRLVKKPTQTVEVLKGKSINGLAYLLAEHQQSFDLIYIDGAHDAQSVITDACMAWPLLKKGGIMVFDDYLWNLLLPLDHRPKMAIDLFTILFNSRLVSIACGSHYAVRKR
jgi:predicted O-methyltransferase YrrM